MRKQLLLKQVLFAKFTHCIYEVNFFCMKYRVNNQETVPQKNFKSGALIFL